MIAIIACGILAGYAVVETVRVERLRRRLARQAEAIAGLARGCDRMTRAADSFRDLYLRELAHRHPQLAEQLRHKWAAQNAPLHVAQLLERAKHG